MARETQSLDNWVTGPKAMIASPKAYRMMYPLGGNIPASQVRARLIEWRKLHRG